MDKTSQRSSAILEKGTVHQYKFILQLTQEYVSKLHLEDEEFMISAMFNTLF